MLGWRLDRGPGFSAPASLMPPGRMTEMTQIRIARITDYRTGIWYNRERRTAMLTVCGWDLQLDVDTVFCQSDSCFLGSATDEDGQRWLVQHRRVPDVPVWVCAAVSPRMLEEVEAGRAEASDVFRHSLTGTVEIVSADDRDEFHRDRCVCCADLPDGLIAPGRLPAPPRSGGSRSGRRRPASGPAGPAGPPTPAPAGLPAPIGQPTPAPAGLPTPAAPPTPIGQPTPAAPPTAAAGFS